MIEVGRLRAAGLFYVRAQIPRSESPSPKPASPGVPSTRQPASHGKPAPWFIDWSLGFGAWDLVPGIWSLGFGACTRRRAATPEERRPFWRVSAGLVGRVALPHALGDDADLVDAG